MKIANCNKEIRIIYCISGDKIKLKTTINITTDTILDLYIKILNETNKVNILNIKINKYLYNCIENSLIDTSIYLYYNNCKCIKELLNENYNEDYIEISLTFSSYIPYIKNLFITYLNDMSFLYCYEKEYKQIFIEKNKRKKKYTSRILQEEYKFKLHNNFTDGMKKLNNDYISTNDYNEIELYIVNNKIEITEEFFLLNEIKKYLTIN